ncbi:GRID2 [Branchiostoma lanceolatum]|uniref:GRID2 protein n=1 Tax=Branchiostoma lanceolatum TaxID=7740 RepID=A0A8J9Z2X0_BRALA|nr:GRID2 [Branchiostoma lanceolatum]
MMSSLKPSGVRCQHAGCCGCTVGVRRLCLPIIALLVIGWAVRPTSTFLVADHMVDVPIGAVFEANRSTLDEEAFLYAVGQINQGRTVLPKARLVPHVERLHSPDPFRAIQTGCSLLGKGVAAMLSCTSCPANYALQTVGNTLHIPHIFVSHDENCRVMYSRGYTLSMRPSQEEVDRHLVDVITQLNWKSMMVFFDDYYDFSHVQSLLSLTRKTFLEVVLLRVEKFTSESDVTEWHTSEKRSPFVEYGGKLRRAVVLCSVENSVRLVKQASEAGIFTPEHNWIIANKEVTLETLRSLHTSSGVFTVMRRPLSYNEYTNRFLRHWATLDTSDRDVRTLDDARLSAAYMYDAVHLLASAFSSLLNTRGWIGPNRLTCKTDTLTPWNGGLMFMDTLRQVQFPGVMGRSKFSGSGYNVDAHVQVLRLDRRQNRTKMRQEEPFVFRTDSSEGPDFSGFCMDLLKELSIMLDFDYELYEVHDGKYGSRRADGTWDGMIGDVIMGADFAVGATVVTATREEVVDFTLRFMDFSLGVLMKQAEDENYFFFLKPFHPKVWLCAAAALCVVCGVLLVLHRVQPDKPNVLSARANRQSLSYPKWFAYNSLLKQGGHFGLRHVSRKILAGVWWFFAFFLLSSYTAEMAAILTVTRMENPINSFEDLSSQTELPYGTVAHSGIAELFSESSLDTYRRMWSYMTSGDYPGTLVSTTDMGIRRARKGRYAFVWDHAVLEHAVRTVHDCRLAVVQQSDQIRGYGIAFPQGHPFKDKVSLAILQLQENGRLEAMKEKWWPRHSRCMLGNSHISQSSSLNLKKFSGVFFVLAGGVFLACLLAGLERVARRRKNREKRSPPSENGSIRQKSVTGYAPSAVTVTSDDSGDLHIVVVPSVKLSSSQQEGGVEKARATFYTDTEATDAAKRLKDLTVPL